MTKISVVVPVYNVEMYIKNCIDSILSQMYKDFELILVDDGSRDNSGIICDEYANIDARITVYHKKNGGVSTARNYGIERAKGKWLCFVDSDDTIDQTYLSGMIKGTLLDPEVDIVMSGYRNVNQYGKTISEHQFDKEYYENNIASIIQISEVANIINSPVSKLFRTDIIKRKDLQFDIKISYGEDHLFVLDYLKYSKGCFFLKDRSYNYYHRDIVSLSHANCINMITYVEKLHLKYETFYEMIYSDKLKETINNQLYKHIVRAAFFLLISNTTDKRNYYHKLYVINESISDVTTLQTSYSIIWYFMKLPEFFSYACMKLFSIIKSKINSIH